ncbi:MAG: hypothetical protein JZU52_01645 [Lamprocystis purpurea]|jgi:hypothetical protein|uniref:hypothetical protein n=1 Tax=Lamprocystis purpurea TaxID=61598 RepID=UPI0003621516|nr:hypothetical protein [Lamprocystis purpurea]MBV5272380.1 hypothetical protein [Lamprocystis purpurea]
MANSDVILDLTGDMERLINEGQGPEAIMCALYDLAWSLHQSGNADRFAIGDGIYSLRDLKRIQDQEEHDAFIERHSNCAMMAGRG